MQYLFSKGRFLFPSFIFIFINRPCFKTPLTEEMVNNFRMVCTECTPIPPHHPAVFSVPVSFTERSKDLYRHKSPLQESLTSQCLIPHS